MEAETKMERVRRICAHPVFRSSLESIRALEEERIFCRHGVEHALDVARIAYIENMEQKLHIPKEIIYAAALLHDIGRHLQYQSGLAHEKGSALIAEEILENCGFETEEQGAILSAIRLHRMPDTAHADGLAGLIYRADKASRMCLFCPALGQCDWSVEKKNLELSV